MPPRTRKRTSYHRKEPNAISAANRRSTNQNELVKMEMMDKECMFCKHKDIDETKYGPLYKLNDVIVHYFCILLSTLAIQNGTDYEGIWGFLIDDIKIELKRGSTQVCFYCKKTGATISCSNRQCRKIFHLPCGLKNGSLHQFFQTFKSFCQQHRATQRVDSRVLNNTTPVPCVICTDDVHPAPVPDSLWAPCCGHNSWYHRKCIQEMALNSGYFFKCPLCNNVDVFKYRMLALGIYIPSRDASWESGNAYAELLERPNLCSAPKCLCPSRKVKKNNEDEDESQKLVLCNTCGSVAIHMLCGNLECDQSWTCESCETILLECSKAKKRRIESPNKELISPTSELRNGESVASTSRIMHEQTNVSTGIITRRSAKLAANRLITVKKGETSTKGLSNRHAEASTSKISSRQVETSTCRLSNRPAEASTSRLSNSQAEASTSGQAEVSTYGLSNGQAEAPTRNLVNGLANSLTSRLINKQESALTRSIPPSRGYNLRCSSKRNIVLRDSENMIIDTNTNTFEDNEPQPSTSNPSVRVRRQRNYKTQSITSNPRIFNEETITISDDSANDDSDDDLQVVGYIDRPRVPPRPQSPSPFVIQNVISMSVANNPPSTHFITRSLPNMRVIANVDLTQDDD